MLPRKIDLVKAYNRVKPELTTKEAQAIERSLNAKPFRALFTSVADKVHWYLLDAPMSTCGRRFGTANSWEEAEKAVRTLLGPTATGGLTT